MEAADPNSCGAGVKERPRHHRSEVSRREREGPGETVHLVASGGGHIDLLVALAPVLADYRRVWLAQASERGKALRSAGEEVEELPSYDRNPLRGNFLKNFVASAKIVLRDRPRAVVTSGAGIAVPFCVLARLMGARVVFIETMARVTSPSASGRVLARLASAVFVQWPELATAYPRARHCQPALLDAVRPQPANEGEGTFVGVGTHSQPFDRLLEMVDSAIEAGVLPEPAVVQAGVSSYRSPNLEVRPFLTPSELQDAVGRARYVVCHAGSGIISAALRAGRRPLVLARLKAEGEHFDDHQRQIVTKLADLGLVVPIDGPITGKHLRAARTPLARPADGHGAPLVDAALAAELHTIFSPDVSHHPSTNGSK